MPIIILFILIGMPLLEISVFSEVASEIGLGLSIVLTLATAAFGIYIVRLQGLIVMNKMRESLAQSQPPVESLIHGFFLFFAGLFLLIPGFITDSLGALLLFPFIRLYLGKAGFATFILQNPTTPKQKDQNGNTIIEGQFETLEDENDNRKDTT